MRAQRQPRSCLAILFAAAATLLVVLACVGERCAAALCHPLPAPVVDERPRCDFAYDGPLRPVDLNCFLDLFPFATPVALAPVANTTHDVRGIRPTPAAAAAGTPPPVPIFIPFRDRLSVLLEAVRSLHRHIRTPWELVIINDQTTHPVALSFLERAVQAGVHVHTNIRRWDNFDALYKILADYIDSYMASSSTSPVYVLTDPDCALDSAPGDILLVYAHALTMLRLRIAGASIRWDDWPAELPGGLGYEDFKLRRGLSPEGKRMAVRAFKYAGRNYHYLEAPVDTTFAMYRAGVPMQRLAQPSIRILPPLAVRHLVSRRRQ